MNRPGGQRVCGGRGQTVIETVLMLGILLLLFFLIAEFSRAWYLKNSLNNAVRVGARIAVVTPGLASPGTTSALCPSDAGSAILNAVCNSPGVPGGTTVVMGVSPNDPAGLSGDTVIINATAPFVAIVPLVEELLPASAFSSASMRHE